MIRVFDCVFSRHVMLLTICLIDAEMRIWAGLLGLWTHQGALLNMLACLQFQFNIDSSVQLHKKQKLDINILKPKNKLPLSLCCTVSRGWRLIRHCPFSLSSMGYDGRLPLVEGASHLSLIGWLVDCIDQTGGLMTYQWLEIRVRGGQESKQ